MALATDRIVSALLAQLAGLPGSSGVHVKPLSMLDESDLDCVLIDNVSDVLVERVGFWPSNETRKFSCDIVPIVMSPQAAALSTLSTLHEAVFSALLSTRDAVTLGGLLKQPLDFDSDDFFADTKSLQQPVCGWTLRVSCQYAIRLDRPGLINEG